MTVLAIEWRRVAAHPDYEVSSGGDVRRIGGRPMRPWRHRSGHLYVGCWDGVRSHKRQVHRLVLCAFAGLPPADGYEACHRDGNPANNAIANLYWGTRAQNIADSVAHRQRHAKSLLTFEQADNLRRAYNGRHGEKRRLARLFGLSESMVGRILNGQTYRSAS